MLKKVLAEFPEEAQEIYYKNKETLEIEYDASLEVSGNYDCKKNKITLRNEEALEHELFHMACNDKKNYGTEISFGIYKDNGVAFADDKGNIYGEALTEGLVESLARKTNTKKKILGRTFETYIANLLISIHGKKLYHYLLMNNPYSFYECCCSNSITTVVESLDLYEVAWKQLKLIEKDGFLTSDKISKYDFLMEITERYVKSITDTISGIIREYNNCISPKITRIEFKEEIKKYFYTNVFLTDGVLTQMLGRDLKQEIEDIINNELMQKQYVKK